MKKTLFWVVLLAMVFSFVGVVEAQEMAIQYYLLPVQQVGNWRGPMYLKWRYNPDGLDVRWGCKDYGSIDQFVCAVGTDQQTDHDWLAVQDGVYQFPANLETNPSPQELSELETTLEAAYIPADWLGPGDTWREVLRTVTGMFLFMQRVTAIVGSNPLEWGVTLNTQFQNLDQDKQDAIIQACDELDYDSSVIKANWTLRVILKNMADQWGEKPIYFGFTTL